MRLVSAIGPALRGIAAWPGRHRSAAGALAWITGGFVLLVGAVMFVGLLRQPHHEPWTMRELQEARAALHRAPTNEALIARIRVLDHELRQAYFTRLDRNRRGAWLLFGAGALLVVAMSGLFSGTRLALGRTAPAPQDREREALMAGRTVALTGALVLAGIAALGLLAPTGTLERASAVAEATKRAAAAPDSAESSWPTAEALARNWPRFLGASGANHAAAEGLPVRWGADVGNGVLWKTPISLPGFSSPIVWEQRVFVTGGNNEQRRVFCLDAKSGTLLWDRPVTSPGETRQVRPPELSGAAACTPATDGRRVFAIFGTGEMGALDFEGELLWSRRFDFSVNAYGHASSLVVWRDRVFVQADQGHADDGRSELLALDAATGEVVWRVKRPVSGSWATPALATLAGKEQLVLAGDPFLIAYDPANGSELWRADVLGSELAPSPVVMGDLVIASSPGIHVVAVKADGAGDVTETRVVWKDEEDVPDVSTPVVAGGLLYSIDTAGRFICRDAATGAKIWEHDFEEEAQASPLVAGERIYIFGQSGKVWVLEAGRELRELAAFDLGEEVYASPAVAAGRLYLRTKEHVCAIGGPDAGGGSGAF
jgi:outer membrane protein assembly factor BamB